MIAQGRCKAPYPEMYTRHSALAVCLVATAPKTEWAIVGWLCKACREFVADRGMRDRWVRKSWLKQGGSDADV